MKRGVEVQSLLLGNGIDIQFGGMACTSSYIIKRIKYRALMDSYAELFNYQISAGEIVRLMNDFVSETNKIIHGEYDDYVIDVDTKEALNDFKCRYSKEVTKPDEIMMEDWLFIVHMFFLKNIDLEDNRAAAVQGFREPYRPAQGHQSQKAVLPRWFARASRLRGRQSQPPRKHAFYCAHTPGTQDLRPQ